MNQKNLTGHILVAPPKIIDRRFNNSVIYIVSHTPVGAWGLVTNKIGPTPIREMLDRIGMPGHIPGNLYLGGPVNPTSVHFIHTTEVLSTESTVNDDGLAVSGDLGFVSQMLGGEMPERYRAFIGACSWGPGQLEGEMMGEEPWTPDHSWLTAPADPGIVLELDGMDQWREAVEHCAKATVRDWMN